jgi:tetratricopeptide (TPR) repeat protein
MGSQTFTGNTAGPGASQIFGNSGTVTSHVGHSLHGLSASDNARVHTGDVHNHYGQPAQAPQPTFFKLPPNKVANFIPRPELMAQLQACFAEESTTSRIAVLRGMGGQGKSQLALEYCAIGRASGQLKAIYWLDASSDTFIARSFEEISLALDTSSSFDNQNDRLNFVRSTIEAWDFPWLLVFDNYDRPDITLNIATCFPQTKYGSIIVTSRHASSAELGMELAVDGMTESESLSLLFSRSQLARNADNVDLGRSVVSLLGHLPLAIMQAGSYIKARKLSLASFMKHYKDRKPLILEHTPALTDYRRKLNDADAETALNVFTTLELSLQGLSGDVELIEDFFTLSAFFDISSIGENLFEVAAQIGNPPWKSLCLSEKMWDTYKYQDVLAILNNLSLLQSLLIEEKAIFSLHPLVADWLVLRRDASSRRDYTIQSCSAAEEFIYSNKDSLAAADRTYWIGQVMSCWANQCAYLTKSDFEDETVLGQLLTFAGFLKDNALLKEAEKVYVRMLEGFEKAFGPDHTSTLRAVNNLGMLYQDQGKLELTEQMYERTLAGYEKALGPDHTSTLDTVNNLGILYCSQGKLELAEQMFERALMGYEKALGPDPTSTLGTVHNLGMLYQDQGKLELAEQMYERALAGKEKVLGPDHTSTLGTVNNLGALYFGHGKLELAVQMHERALAGFEKALGPDHTSTCNTKYHSGMLFKKLRKFEEAEKMFEQALKGYIKVIGPDYEWAIESVKRLEEVRFDKERATV